MSQKKDLAALLRSGEEITFEQRMKLVFRLSLLSFEVENQ